MKTLEPTKLEIIDKSGGCGAMFDIFVESSVFKVISQFFNFIYLH